MPRMATDCTEAAPISDVLAMTINTSSETTEPITLLTGPASVVRISSRTKFLKLRVFTGVGLAQPISGMRVTIATRGSMIVPTGSICLMRVERNAAQHACRLVAQPRSHPSMCRLVQAEREQQHHKFERSPGRFQEFPSEA